MKLTLHRRGTVRINQNTANQCKEIGWQSLNYIVRITTGPGLDENGYLLRHEAIHQIMEMAVATGGSCEQLAQRSLEMLIQECGWHQHIRLLKLVVRIIPNMAYPMAFMEAEYEAIQDERP